MKINLKITAPDVQPKTKFRFEQVKHKAGLYQTINEDGILGMFLFLSLGNERGVLSFCDYDSRISLDNEIFSSYAFVLSDSTIDFTAYN